MTGLTPLTMPYGNFTSIPNAFDDSLTLLQKLLKVTQTLNDVINYINNGGTLPDPIGGNPLTDLTTEVNDLLTRMTNQETMWKQVNGSPSAKAGESVYIPNDDNLFGYMAPNTSKVNGETFLNLSTVEQNNIIVTGDSGSGQPHWIEAGTYHSLRAPQSPSYQQLDSDGNPLGVGRTMKHQGNSSYHFVGFAASDLVLPVNTYTTLTNITTVNLQFPANAWNGSGYLIPRNGIYEFNPKIKVSAGITSGSAGSIRFALLIVHSDGTTTQSDIEDVDYNGSYTTPFKGVTFQYALSLGDTVYVQVRPLKDTLTITNGSQIHIYGLGDTIQS